MFVQTGSEEDINTVWLMIAYGGECWIPSCSKMRAVNGTVAAGVLLNFKAY